MIGQIDIGYIVLGIFAVMCLLGLYYNKIN